MNYAGKRVGIWGFGTTGKSLLNFFTKQHALIEIFDHRILTDDEQQIIRLSGAHVRSCHDLASFLRDNAYIVPSQGIDIRRYHGMARYIAEVDLFAQQYTQPYIGVTGSCGKTTVATFLSRLLTTDTLHIPACGNIGLPMLDILEHQTSGTIVELSSTQLELSTQVAPDLALWTNLHPNHLDRHGTLSAYCAAKMALIRSQKTGQRALLPLALYDQLPAPIAERSGYAFFTTQQPTATDYARIHHDQSLYVMDEMTVICHHNNHQRIVHSSPLFAQITYPENWLILTAALDMLAISPRRIDALGTQLTLPDHRLMHIASVRGVDFYNDSKATIPASTLAAVKQLQPKPIVLFLGGVSKGVNRQQLIRELVGTVRYVICFGAESQQLATWCCEATIAASAHDTLDDAFAHCLVIMRPADSVLFSPAGASFDLFENYGKRGERFKQLVKQSS